MREKKNKQFSFLRRRYRETDFLFIGRRKGGNKNGNRDIKNYLRG